MLLDEMLKTQTQHIVALHNHTNMIMEEIMRYHNMHGSNRYKTAYSACVDLCTALENVIQSHHVDFIAHD